MSRSETGKSDLLKPLLAALDEVRSHLDRVQDGLVQSFDSADSNRRLYEGIFSGSRDAIFILEQPDGKIRQANAAAAELTGYALDELQRMSIAELHHEADRDHGLQVFKEVGKVGGIKSRRLDLLCAGGSLKPVSISAHVLADCPDGWVVAFVRDVTERVAAEQKQKKLNEDLERRVAERTKQIDQSKRELELAVRHAQELEQEARHASEVKSRFLAATSHELRTPLNAVIGMTELLLDMELGREQQETADIIATTAKGLLAVVNDILDFSKIEAGKLELDVSVFNLTELLNEIQDAFALQAKQKDLSLNLKIADGLPEFVVGDAQRLRQILFNLIGNALKFTDSGGVKVQVMREKSRTRSQAYRFTVTDSGIGIPKERHAELFEPFSQIKSEGRPDRGGTGLGLNITRQLVDLMEGEIGLQSKPGKGSTFWFVVELEEPTVEQVDGAVAEAKCSEPDAEELRDNLRVLLVEDNAINQRVALSILEKLGIEAVVTDNGQQALDLLAEREFDLVFMDIVLPGLSGLEVTRLVRDEDAGELNVQTPIVAMTANATRQDRQLCLDAGMDDYIAKPVSAAKIHAAITRVLHPEAAELIEVQDVVLEQAVSVLDGQAEELTGEAATFKAEALAKLPILIGALYNCDFGFSLRECRLLSEKVQVLKAEGITALVGDLEVAVGKRQQERALALASELQSVLETVPVAN